MQACRCMIARLDPSVYELVPRAEVLAAAHGTPVGFALVEDRSSFVGGFFNWDAAISGGAFQFVDLVYGCRCIGKKQHERQPQFPLEARCDRSIPSPISVHLLPTQAIGKWWLPPIYEARIEIRESRTGAVLARATDVIFGGGLIGKYMRLIGGDQDFERLSCGYASADIGPWRPSLSTRPQVREYEQADRALLLAPFRETKSADVASPPNPSLDTDEQARRSTQR